MKCGFLNNRKAITSVPPVAPPPDRTKLAAGIKLPYGKVDKSNLPDVFGIYDHLSRVNHSCRPNAAHTFNIASSPASPAPCEISNRARRSFYYLIEVPTAQRQKLLEPYGLRCACAYIDPDGSDRQSRQIMESAEGLGPSRLTRSREEQTRSGGEFRWLAKIESPGLQKLVAYERHMEAVARSSVFIGKVEICQVWAVAERVAECD